MRFVSLFGFAVATALTACSSPGTNATEGDNLEQTNDADPGVRLQGSFLLEGPSTGTTTIVPAMVVFAVMDESRVAQMIYLPPEDPEGVAVLGDDYDPVRKTVSACVFERIARADDKTLEKFGYSFGLVSSRIESSLVESRELVQGDNLNGPERVTRYVLANTVFDGKPLEDSQFGDLVHSVTRPQFAGGSILLAGTRPSDVSVTHDYGIFYPTDEPIPMNIVRQHPLKALRDAARSERIGGCKR